eukprot:TRINITY_DN5131_c2_g1_i1.p1 TRINITY_DN5131_c2_g1~~TRINITY_DN5131_c2_g1_i1.p1  ORF type:complete len:233 (+),score=45.27 TRINITY_DN5131_c2_g1_i1:40-699(+)
MPEGERSDALLNTGDIKRASKWMLGEANDYQKISAVYHKIEELLGSESAVTQWCGKKMDYTGNGKVGKDDFRLMHGSWDAWLDKKSPTLDRNLPYTGQLLFAFGMGYTGARFIKFAWRHKFKVFIGGVLVGNAVNAILTTPSHESTQEVALARHHIESTMYNTSSIVPFCPCGRKELETFFDTFSLGVINRKLGPSGLPEGPTAGLSIGLGLWWGLRVL